MKNITSLLASYYAEIDILCIILLGTLFFKAAASSFALTQKRQFSIVLLCHILFCASDLIWIFNNDFLSLTETFPKYGITFSYVVNGLNVLCSAVTGLSWLAFSETMQGYNLFKKKRNLFFALFPVAVLALLVVATNKTHILFHLTDSGEFSRDHGYFLQLAVSYGYILFATVLSIRHSNTAKNNQERNMSLNIARFIIGPILAGILQLFIPHMQLLFVGTVFALVNVYISILGLQVNLDALTKLNNRSMLDQKIANALNIKSADSELFLLMFDIDKFKKINDIYGHPIGDKALVLVANAIKKNCNGDDYACRYGGDEFVMLHHAPPGDNCRQLVKNIENAIKKNDLPCELTFSVGISQYEDSLKTPIDFLNAADREMYRVKVANRNGR